MLSYVKQVKVYKFVGDIREICNFTNYLFDDKEINNFHLNDFPHSRKLFNFNRFRYSDGLSQIYHSMTFELHGKVRKFIVKV